jgi:Histidine kinase-, DNA gyrase B-, and HSP90-like ATPase/PAS fold
MSDGALPTAFAPAERDSLDQVRNQADAVAGSQHLRELLDAVPTIVLILNDKRQIVYANEVMLGFLGLSDGEGLLGRRPGEVLDCIHSTETEGGCGTTDFCKTCGAVRAILACQQSGKRDQQECRITRKQDGEALDLRVWTTPFSLGSHRFTTVAVSDISDEKRRRALEHIFFHDVLNVAAGLKGMSDLVARGISQPNLEYFKRILMLSRQIIDEIDGQRDLDGAETGELQVQVKQLRSRQLLESVVEVYTGHPTSLERSLVIAADAVDTPFLSDGTLLRRILGNMTKNALEACKPGEGVVLGCPTAEGRVRFSVHNPGAMPEEVRLQVFQRSFSTKGRGRGLGTYSMKLLSERYLKGTVTFTTDQHGGTTFFAEFSERLEVPAPSAPSSERW